MQDFSSPHCGAGSWGWQVTRELLIRLDVGTTRACALVVDGARLSHLSTRHEMM
jgi:hypothetical protein